jgi:ribose 5-phosphate isomerase B
LKKRNSLSIINIRKKMTPTESEIRALVEKIVRRTLGEAAPAAEAATPMPTVTARGGGNTVALGADHGGYPLKESLKQHLTSLNCEVIDCGTHSTDAVDYPDLAYAVARLVSEGKAWRGIIIDGAGIGSAMVANKVPHVRAALCYDHASAMNSREHNDANVLTLGAGLIGANLAKQIVEVWLKTEFGGGRHAKRVAKIMDVEKRFLKDS